MSVQHKIWTYNDYLQLDDDKRYEIIDGELIEMPSPKRIHQKIVLRLSFLIELFLTQNDFGEVYTSPFDVVFAKDSVYQPDLIFVSSDNIDILTEDNISGSPDLVVEVLSQDKNRDRVKKFAFYEQFKVKEYWIIDSEQQSIEIYGLKNDKLVLDQQGKDNKQVKSSVLKGFKVSYQGILDRKRAV